MNEIPKTIRVLRLPVGREPHVATIAHTLEALQHEVSGRIEPFATKLHDMIALCDEEFLYNGNPVNTAANRLRAPGVGQIWGDVILVGDAGQEFGDISPYHVAAVELLLGVDIKEETLV